MRPPRRRVTLFLALALCPFLFILPPMHAETNPDAEIVAARQRLKKKVDEIAANKTPEQVRGAIDAWKAREPASAEPFAASANYELSLSGQKMAVYDFMTNGIPRTAPPDGREYSIRDPKTGKEVGVLGERPIGPKPDAATAKEQQLKAAAVCAEGLKRFPDRLDFMITRCIALDAARAWKEFGAQMASALQRAATEPEKLRWLEDMKPPFPPAEELLNGLQGVIGRALQEGGKAGVERARDLAEIGLKYYPREVRLLSDMGSSYAGESRWELALPYYEAARSNAPEDNTVRLNLAQAYHWLGREKESRATLQAIIQSGRDPGIAELARQLLGAGANEASPDKTP